MLDSCVAFSGALPIVLKKNLTLFELNKFSTAVRVSFSFISPLFCSRIRKLISLNPGDGGSLGLGVAATVTSFFLISLFLLSLCSNSLPMKTPIIRTIRNVKMSCNFFKSAPILYLKFL